MSYLPGSDIVRHFNADLSPVALWLGDGTLTEVIGARTLTVNAGTERYAMLSRYVRGWYFDGATILRYAVSDATLQLDDAFTLEAIISHSSDITAIQSYCSVGAAGETLGSNYMFRSEAIANGTHNQFWENGAGVNVLVPSQVGMPVGRPFHLAFTRSAASGGLCTAKLYVDGKLLNTTAGVARAEKDPVPANNVQQLGIGGDWQSATDFFRGAIGSVKVFNYELTAAQVLAESNYIRG